MEENNKQGEAKMKASELKDEELKSLKKSLKLPTKKELVYFKQKSHLEFQQYNVTDFEIIKELPSASVLKVYLDNNDAVFILSDYFVEMQKSNFVQTVSNQ